MKTVLNGPMAAARLRSVRPRRLLSAVACAAALSAACAPAAQAADRPYSLDGETQVMGDLAVYQPDHVFWSLHGRTRPVKVNFPCQDQDGSYAGGAVMQRFASADGRRVWALADLPTGNVEVANPGAKNPTTSQPEVCAAMNQAFAVGRETRVFPAAFLLLSEDAGAHWRLAATVPEPGDGTLPTADELDLQLAGEGTRVGSPELGWSTYDAAGQPMALWAEQGASHGVLSNLDIDPQAPRPRGYDRLAARTLDDGSVITAWAKGGRTQVLHGKDGIAVKRTTSAPRFRVRVQAGNYGCPTPKTVLLRGFRQMLPGSDTQTVWGITTTTEQVRCPGSSLSTTLNLGRVLARSTNGGRTWREVKAPAEMDALVAANGKSVVAGFARRGCDGLVARRLDGRTWRTLGCRPLNPQVDQ